VITNRTVWAYLGLMLFAGSAASAQCAGADGPIAPEAWKPYFQEGAWTSQDGVLASRGDALLSGRVIDVPGADVLVDAEVRSDDSGRRNFGILLRARDNDVCVTVRYYDQLDCLEMIPYANGKYGDIVRTEARLGLQPDAWWRLKAAAIGHLVLAKCWPADSAEPPEWQLRAPYPNQRPGGAGVHVHDGARASFRNVRICYGAELETMRAALAAEEAAQRQHALDTLRLSVNVTPFVLRAPDTPKRRVHLQPVSDAGPFPLPGALSVTFAGTRLNMTVELEELQTGPITLYLPEPETPTNLEIAFQTDAAKTLEQTVPVAPVRPWTFYMTPHTHYDIGYTEPQPVVINRLTREMNDAVHFCEETADWPPDSRYRWTVEVSALMKEYIDRHAPEKVARFMDFVRDGRIEICGFYLNMPTELVGHEELIRCLYFADTLRRRYRVPIDTIMIDDVPGYTWALPELLVEARMPRAALRANSIRGQFLWHRPGAAPRPFYWEGPDGSRVFVWYTDSYREGNFFREPGLHEEEFLKIIRRNEEAGAFVDLVQLRMGGDNLPPDLDASKNARQWNEKYLWPRIVVATNREYLDALEKQYGAQTETRRGDIPSWWADGPASTARETGMNRLVHDRLAAAEALQTLLALAEPAAAFPTERIAHAYNAMLHFDEHTWGASRSISEPDSVETREQWAWKARQAADARELTDTVLQDALTALARRVPAPRRPGVVVWNTLPWARDDVVELALAGSPLENAAGAVAANVRTGIPVPVQFSPDHKRAWFVARDIPALGYAVYEFRDAPETRLEMRPPDDFTLENEAYRLVMDTRSGAWREWYSKELRRGLLDASAAFHGNQPVHDQPVGGREAVSAKAPVEFERTAAAEGEIIGHWRGPVFSEFVRRTSLPHAPEIVQRVRLYDGLPWVDVENTVRKEANTGPESVYFAFPFDVPEPVFHAQIADAVMRPGIDQLPHSCFDFYSIQHWLDVSGQDFGVIFAPLEAPVVTLGGINTYRWADTLAFDKGHVFSLVMNNCWDTNFKADQEGDTTFRYRLAAYAGEYDPVRATRIAWQPFHPLLTTWLAPRTGPESPLPESFLRLEGDAAIASCIKTAESGEGFVVRLLEQRGAPASVTLRFSLPEGRRVARAHVATALEAPTGILPVSDNVVTVALRPNEIYTLLVIPAPL